jgi:hypothetical protein
MGGQVRYFRTGPEESHEMSPATTVHSELFAAEGVPAKPKATSAVTVGSEAKSNMRQDVFSLAEGAVTIQWPSSLSRESYEDLGAWLDILKRKIGRSVNSTGTE